MSGFVRPEVSAALLRWREVLIALAVLALGLFFTRLPGPVVQGLGLILTLAGIGFAIVGWRRVRFRGAGNAPGAVRVDEGQIGYFGPSDGGAVALSLMTQLHLNGPASARVWHIRSEIGEALDIPHDAAGAEALFDIFAALPGMSADHLLRSLKGTQTGTVIVWQRGDVAGLTPLDGRSNP